MPLACITLDAAECISSYLYTDGGGCDGMHFGYKGEGGGEGGEGEGGKKARGKKRVRNLPRQPEREREREREIGTERDGKIVINRCFFMTEERRAAAAADGVFFWADDGRAEFLPG